MTFETDSEIEELHQRVRERFHGIGFGGGVAG
jgi:hypothetical protein